MTDAVQDTKLYVPALGGLNRFFAPYAYPLIRFASGTFLLTHGIDKIQHNDAPALAAKLLAPMGFPAPMAFAWFVVALETVGAVMVAVGLFTRAIAVMLVVEFAVIAFDVQMRPGANPSSFKYSLLMWVIFVAIAMRGGDRLSVDRAIGREF